MRCYDRHKADCFSWPKRFQTALFRQNRRRSNLCEQWKLCAWYCRRKNNPWCAPRRNNHDWFKRYSFRQNALQKQRKSLRVWIHLFCKTGQHNWRCIGWARKNEGRCISCKRKPCWRRYCHRCSRQRTWCGAWLCQRKRNTVRHRLYQKQIYRQKFHSAKSITAWGRSQNQTECHQGEHQGQASYYDWRLNRSWNDLRKNCKSASWSRGKRGAYASVISSVQASVLFWNRCWQPRKPHCVQIQFGWRNCKGHRRWQPCVFVCWINT